MIFWGKIDFHHDAAIEIAKPDYEGVSFMGYRWQFHVGRYLLIGGFLLGVALLMFYGLKR